MTRRGFAKKSVLSAAAAAGATWFDQDVSTGVHHVVLRTDAGATWETTVEVSDAGPSHVCWNFELATPCN